MRIPQLVMPGLAAGLSKLAGVDASEEDVNALVASTVPLGKVGSKWDIAIAAVFLASSAARHLTGGGPISRLIRRSRCMAADIMPFTNAFTSWLITLSKCPPSPAATIHGKGSSRHASQGCLVFVVDPHKQMPTLTRRDRCMAEEGPHWTIQGLVCL